MKFYSSLCYWFIILIRSTHYANAMLPDAGRPKPRQNWRFHQNSRPRRQNLGSSGWTSGWYSKKSPKQACLRVSCVHQGITLTKEVDKSSPKLFQALTSGEQMKSVVLEFYRISPKGTEEKYYTITLSNAVIVSARTWVPNTLDPNFKQMGHMEDIGITYEKIVWTWVPDGIEAEDSLAGSKSLIVFIRTPLGHCG